MSQPKHNIISHWLYIPIGETILAHHIANIGTMHNLLMLGGCGMLSTLLRCTVLRTHPRIVIIICTWVRTATTNTRNTWSERNGKSQQLTISISRSWWGGQPQLFAYPLQSRVCSSCTGALNSPVAQFSRNNDVIMVAGDGGDEGCFHPEQLNPE